MLEKFSVPPIGAVNSNKHVEVLRSVSKAVMCRKNYRHATPNYMAACMEPNDCFEISGKILGSKAELKQLTTNVKKT